MNNERSKTLYPLNVWCHGCGAPHTFNRPPSSITKELTIIVFVSSEHWLYLWPTKNQLSKLISDNMLFNSISFAIFFTIVFLAYWLFLKKSIKKQNILLLIASYAFYACWDWRFLFLIIFSSVVDYLVGIAMEKQKNAGIRKRLLLLSLLTNLGLLFIFKYFNFFIDSFESLLLNFGFSIKSIRLNLILPVGISFYTFQTLSYSIDIYRKKLKAEHDIVAFFTYVSFFPQLVAGPIERATHLLPQFKKQREINYTKLLDGFGQVVWGLFKKMVIADNCASIVNQVFSDYGNYSSTTLLLGAVMFSFQIYGDFSGYSDIAIGVSRMLGFDLKQNFAFPYFSRNVAEFWRRWHISLTSWFRDYLYIPLGGSRAGKYTSFRNTMIVFTVCGFWHGANWTFIVWGLVNALLFLPLLLTNNNRKHLEVIEHKSLWLNMKEFFNIGITFTLISLSWVFFRADTLGIALDYLKQLFSFKDVLSIPYVFGIGVERSITILSFVAVFVIIEWFGRKKQYALELTNHFNKTTYWCVLYIIAITTFLFKGSQQEFIYFQF